MGLSLGVTISVHVCVCVSGVVGGRLRPMGLCAWVMDRGMALAEITRF